MNKDTNRRLGKLATEYGSPTIDFFLGDGYTISAAWRIWFQDWHYHPRIKPFGQGRGRISSGSEGFAAQGKTLDEAMDRLEAQAKDVPPQPGVHCREGCPYYGDYIY